MSWIAISDAETQLFCADGLESGVVAATDVLQTGPLRTGSLIAADPHPEELCDAVDELTAEATVKHEEVDEDEEDTCILDPRLLLELDLERLDFLELLILRFQLSTSGCDERSAFIPSSF